MQKRARSVHSVMGMLILLTAGCSSVTPNGAERTPGSVEGAGGSPSAELWGTLRATGKRFRLFVQGGDEKSFVPKLDLQTIRDSEQHDVVIVGGGLAGLTAAVYLTDQGRKVLLLEKESHLGGLAAGGSTINGAAYDRGAAYWTAAYREEFLILRHIGLSRYKKENPIPEPIDTYLLNGTLYGAHPFEGIWDDRTLGNLPPEKLGDGPILPVSFAVFKAELKRAYRDGLIPNQPFEEAENLELDRQDAASWIRSMPDSIRKQANEPSGKKARALVARMEAELTSGRIRAADPMGDVVDLMDLYCRSALGAESKKVSAVAFANFYISEIETRYTSDIGTGRAARKMESLLRARPALATILTRATVGSIVDTGSSVEVSYTYEGVTRTASAGHAVFAAQLGLAPRLIRDFAQKAPEQASLMRDLRYSHYSVHAVEVNGHPYRASYDTWVHDPSRDPGRFTDLILGRWMDPAIRGYSRQPDDQGSVLTIYNPISTDWTGRYSENRAAEIAELAVNQMGELFRGQFREPLDILRVTTSRWPFSVHVAEPGHYRNKARILRRPFGRIYFANNNIGTPAFEEALFRGHCAADNIMLKTVRGFKKESWTRCPIE